ncbi:MAG: hypothetical protein ACE5R6_03200 [Candidatus Heimdallarchaeota archaeon]
MRAISELQVKCHLQEITEHTHEARGEKIDPVEKKDAEVDRKPKIPLDPFQTRGRNGDGLASIDHNSLLLTWNSSSTSVGF